MQIALLALSTAAAAGKIQIAAGVVAGAIDSSFVSIVRVMRRERASEKATDPLIQFLPLPFVFSFLALFCVQKCTEGDGVIGAR